MLRKIWAITKKNILMYYLKGPVVIFGVLFPLFLFLAFYIGRSLSAAFLIPGLLAMTIFFTSTSVSPVIMPWETQMKTLERLISCPITVRTMIFGDILASFIFGTIISIVPVVIGMVMGVGVKAPFTLGAAIIIGAFAFSSLGLLFSTIPTDLVSNVMMLSTLVKFPLIFISGIFIPVSELPDWGVAVASLSPLTYFTDIARFSIEGYAFYPLYLDFLLLIASAILFLVLAVKLHERTLVRRF
ncbi:MAG TPA: ABC transporter permease [Candidatus Syntrophoarchaeum butanivorans]|uniref:ABC transporter permease n=1 Tax=Candidatus Syntropharchaeum butanivorans TaxID=1839936 RepID=A0A7J2RZX7_9EURY|nr:ABC transporter permease [Candidatus Syntrophoarchaeum butanivorans]